MLVKTNQKLALKMRPQQPKQKGQITVAYYNPFPKSNFTIMQTISRKAATPDLLLDCSEADQVCYWADVFNVSPQAIKTAVRACCSNSIPHIAHYLKHVYPIERCG
jgi:hypothetical protein